MKVHLIRITVIVLALGGSLLATPVAARPKDPDSFQVTPIQRGGCYFGASFGDPPIGLCPADLPELAANRAGSRRPATAQEVLHNAADAVTSAGALQYALEMRTTTTISGGSWTTQSPPMGAYATPDELRGAVTIATP
jgi:hypothetical protein